MKLCGPDELSVTATIGSLGKALHGNPEQPLAEDHDQVLELRVAQVFICVLHQNLAVVSRIVLNSWSGKPPNTYRPEFAE